MNDTILTALAIVGLSALIHASFQLGASVLTLLSGHSLSVKRSQFRIFRLTSSFVFGAAVTTLLLISFFALIFSYITTAENTILLWSIVSGLAIGVGFAVWFTYYRPGPGTSLWVPRGLAHFLSDRSAATKRSAESFSLGVTSVLGEILFIVAPLVVAAYALVHLPTFWQVISLLVYTLVSLSSLLAVWWISLRKHKLSRIQSWREKNKTFLQYCAASGLVILGGFTFVYEALGGLS